MRRSVKWVLTVTLQLTVKELGMTILMIENKRTLVFKDDELIGVLCSSEVAQGDVSDPYAGTWFNVADVDQVRAELRAALKHLAECDRSVKA